ncbi:unnamed protein product [Arctogadus glacialis]
MACSLSQGGEKNTVEQGLVNTQQSWYNLLEELEQMGRAPGERRTFAIASVLWAGSERHIFQMVFRYSDNPASLFVCLSIHPSIVGFMQATCQLSWLHDK